MAIKKSELYSSLWSSCDELRGGMDASQYKDYVLVMLFIKYVSDKYAGVPYAPITIPDGASFKDMIALKGKPTSAIRSTRKSLGRWLMPTLNYQAAKIITPLSEHEHRSMLYELSWIFLYADPVVSGLFDGRRRQLQY